MTGSVKRQPGWQSVLIAGLVLLIVVAVTLQAASLISTLIIGICLLISFSLGYALMWRVASEGYFLVVGAGLIVFGLLFLFTFLYGEIWALLGLFVYGIGLGILARRFTL